MRNLSPEERRFGRYELLFRLATGGMAQLYVGRLRGVKGFEKLVVIKLIHEEYAQDSSFVKMFIDEARLLGRISHPNVVQVMELGEVEGAYYIAMEYVHGESLGALNHQLQIPHPLCARIVSDAAAGLHAAHELRNLDGTPLGVVHRDVSPGNILISYNGAVKVTDFGVARALDNLSVTHVGILKGKYAYMAPEYLESGKVDRRSDIFALGVVLYEITTRKRLFKSSLEGRTLAQGGTDIIPPSLVVPSYPAQLEQVVLRALEHDPEMRYRTAQEMHNALEQFIIGCGSPALNSDLGDQMVATFASRMAKKRTLISETTRDTSTLPEIAQDPSPGTTLKGQTISAAKRSAERTRRQRTLILVATGLLLAGTVVALTVYVMLPDPLQEEPPPLVVGPPGAEQGQPQDGRTNVVTKTETPKPTLQPKPRPPEARPETETPPPRPTAMPKAEQKPKTRPPKKPGPGARAATKPDGEPEPGPRPRPEPSPKPKQKAKSEARHRPRPKTKTKTKTARPKVKVKVKSKPKPKPKPKTAGPKSPRTKKKKKKKKKKNDDLFGNPFK